MKGANALSLTATLKIWVKKKCIKALFYINMNSTGQRYEAISCFKKRNDFFQTSPNLLQLSSTMLPHCFIEELGKLLSVVMGTLRH